MMEPSAWSSKTLFTILSQHHEAVVKEMFWRLFEEIVLIQCTRESLFNHLNSAIEKSLRSGSLDDLIARLCNLTQKAHKLPTVMVDDCLDIFLSSIESVVIANKSDLGLSEKDVANLLLFFNSLVNLTKSSLQTKNSQSSSKWLSKKSSVPKNPSTLEIFSSHWCSLKKERQTQVCKQLFENFLKKNPSYKKLLPEAFESSNHVELISLFFSLAAEVPNLDLENLDCFSHFRSMGRQFMTFRDYGLNRRHFGDFSSSFIKTVKEMHANDSIDLPKESSIDQFSRDVNSELSSFLHMALIHFVVDSRMTRKVEKDSTLLKKSDASSNAVLKKL